MGDANGNLTNNIDKILWWNRVYKKALRKTCGKCLAAPGDWCQTSNGRRAQYLHKERTKGVADEMRGSYPE